MMTKNMVHSTMFFWLFVYEIVSLSITVILGLLELRFNHIHHIESISFILKHGRLYAIMSMWLANTSSFFLGGALVIINPILGVLSVVFLSISLSDLFVSWLAGYCPTPHFIYGMVETQAYILLWLLIVKVYLKQKSRKDLLRNWLDTVKDVKRIIVLSIIIFFVLSIIEVTEVIVYG